jgi:hypothetical protein
MPNIVIDVAGQAAGSPGVAREFAFSIIDTGSPPLVTMTIDDNSGITQWQWEILDKPDGSTSTLSGATTNTCTFTPSAYIPGTYLVRCTFNAGASYARNAVAWNTRYLGLRIPAAGELLEFGTTKGWALAMRKIILKADSDSAATRKRAVQDYLDNTLAPPSETSGERFLLDNTGASHANWDGASGNDIVQYNAATDTWEAETPEEGWAVFVDNLDQLGIFIDDGAGAWEFEPEPTSPASNAPEDVTKAAAVVGTATDFAREDHKHDASTASAVSLSVPGANAEGNATSLARSNHTHALPDFGIGSGTFCEGNDARLYGTLINVDVVNLSTHTYSATEVILLVTYTATGECTITIPTTEIAKVDRIFRIKDAGFNALVNKIIIETEGSETIDNEASAEININGAAITLCSDGSNLFII